MKSYEKMCLVIGMCYCKRIMTGFSSAERNIEEVLGNICGDNPGRKTPIWEEKIYLIMCWAMRYIAELSCAERNIERRLRKATIVIF